MHGQLVAPLVLHLRLTGPADSLSVVEGV